jgi:hypothetical protein
MADVSDEQAWWSDLFKGEADGAVEIPDGVWHAAVEAALDPETAPPDENLVPTDDPDVASEELGVEAGVHGEAGDPVGHDEADHDGAPDELHVGSEHDIIAGQDAEDHEGSCHDVGHDTDFEDLNTFDGFEGFDDF